MSMWAEKVGKFLLNYLDSCAITSAWAEKVGKFLLNYLDFRVIMRM